VSTVAERVSARFASARNDAGLLQAGLHVEEVCALAYAAAAEGSLRGAARAEAERFAEHERRHAKAYATMLYALTVPVREHARAQDLEALLPGLAEAGEREALRRLEELEEAAIAGQRLMARRLRAREVLRTVAAVMAGGAQHLVVLRRRLGQSPPTKAFETGA